MVDMQGAIRDWHRAEMATAYGLEGARLVMGCPLYGEGYVNDFVDYCAPSLSANKLGATELVLFVDGPAEAALRQFPSIRFKRIPEPIVTELYAQPGHKYALLAAAHNLLIHKAGEVGAGFSMICADMIYSEHYFENLLRLTEHHDAIAHTGFAITSQTGKPALDHFRRGDRLKISAVDLGQISWRHLNSEWRSWGMDGIDPATTDEMPNAHLIYWRGRDHIRIQSSHQNAAWMSPTLCKAAGTALGGTVDSELPRYLGAEFYQPVLADDMACISIAGTTVPTARIPWTEYRKEFWRFIGNRDDFLPYFTRPCLVPVPYDESAPDDADLDGRLASLMARLQKEREL